jgi:PAS domain-containing protein
MTARKKREPTDMGPGFSQDTRSMREAAENKLKDSPGITPDLKSQPPEELVHELQVHQIELETQAEELRKSKIALEVSRDRYIDLYDFAPLGYFTLNDKALITDVNLTGATLFGVNRSKLLMVPFSRFIAENNYDQWYVSFSKKEKEWEIVLATTHMMSLN